MKELIKSILSVVDPAIAPFAYVSARLLRRVRMSQKHLPTSKSAMIKAGAFPIIDHYYEPLFNPAHLRGPLDADRPLPGISWNVDGQLSLLNELDFHDEIVDAASDRSEPAEFNVDNPNFGRGDGEFWYSMIRRMKPRRIVEIGSGYSTLLAQRAIRRTRAADPLYSCIHTCIEPYEMPWLESTGAEVLRQPVENVSLDVFRQLQPNDFLFVDSSHVLRPQGDVVTIFLQILPVLRPGVIVHVHDIFSPRDYPRQWVIDEVRLWNEQYLLEAFLTHNSSWEILAALNYLHHNHHQRVKAICPHLRSGDEPGSFYMRRLR